MTSPEPIILYERGGPEGPLHEDNFSRDNPRARVRGRFVPWKPLGQWQALRIGVAVVRDEEYEYGGRPTIRNGREVAAFFNATNLHDLDREVFLSLPLDTKMRVVGVEEVAVGHLTGVEVHPRELFKSAIIVGASRIIIAHNHPSGDPEPSPQDLALTERIREAGELLGIPLVDSVIIGAPGRYVSLRDRGLL